MLRTACVPFLQSRASVPVLCSTFCMLALGFAIPYTPVLGPGLGFAQVPHTVYAMVAALVVAYCLLVQLVKVCYKRVFRCWL